ncbi:methyl-accepting chemotaxis protein [Paenibacillus sp. HWE-109]|uniref:methyl-accepting chemotaxis protein n=1 Tax=Paenibacillus sp. HWE-109 TaxID=1306526 RepID=UPI001EDE833C|nr:methyl-accepting chemotaxis protein [Paenibacillus sp. HWE-109]UKS28156.1 methyl-accepting chemotaxis protein [Paenibacillus sp. HWE-109]
MQKLKIMVRMLFQLPSRSLGTKLFLIFFCSLGISVAGMGVFSSNIAENAIIDLMKKSSQDLVTTAGEKLDMKQQFYVDLSNQLISDSTFTKNLFQISNAGIGKAELQRRTSEMRDLFDQLALSDQSIRDITLVPIQNSLEIISTEREGVNPELRTANWIQTIRSANGKPVWMPIEENGYLGDSPKPLFAYGRLLGKNNVGSDDFILLVQIEANVLQSMVNGFKLSEGAETLITTQSGKMILSNNRMSNLHDVSLPAISTASGSFIDKNTSGLKNLLAYRQSAVSNWTFIAIAPLDELTHSVSKIRNMTYLFMGLNILVALVIGFWIVFMVGKPLSHMMRFMRLAASGNLTGRLSVHKRKDEIGQVEMAYDQMMENIGVLIHKSRESVNEVAEFSRRMTHAAEVTVTSAREIHAAADQIANGAIDLASNAEESTSRMEQMGRSLSDVLSLQHKMASSAHEVDHVCSAGGSSVTVLLRKAEDTEASFRNVARKVTSLQESAGSVRSILKLLKEIANSTKVLSLNASIEATRAGAAGASFKVISNEIRQLAERSNASIGEVGQYTDIILQEVESTVGSISNTLPFFQDLNQEVYGVYKLFMRIQVEMNQLITRSSDVSASLEKLNDVQTILGQAIFEVSAVSQQSSASTEQVSSLCSTQLTIGDQLLELSARLNLISGQLERQMSYFQTE